MQKVLTAAQMREVDRLTTEKYGIPSIILMENAAHAVARVITEKLGGSVNGKSILILCGKGNNGGDGAALARILETERAITFTILVGKIEDTGGDARTNFEILKGLGDDGSHDFWMVNEHSSSLSDLIRHSGFDLVIDAFFGTGLSKPIGSPYEEILLDLIEAGTPIISVDLPSGVEADSSHPIGSLFSPEVTVTFTAPKRATVLPPSVNLCGKVVVADIGSPQALVNEQPSQLFVSEFDDAMNYLTATAFSDNSYKNKRGHALLIAGSEDYSGAAVLAGNSAMRSGVGLVTLAAPKECKEEIASRLLPEVILKSIDSPDLTSKADAIAIGCGLSTTDPSIEKLVRNVVAAREVPVIIDAGALWFYSPLVEHLSAVNDADKSVRVPLILTPHEGEFLRLLGTDDKDSIKDGVAAVREFATKHNVILILKGERVLIGEPGGKVVVNPTGNSGLGKAGNGDTLTGILAGFVAQANSMKIDIFETVVAAVYIAGMAGDIAEKKFGKRVMTASDVRECLVDVFSEFEKERN